MTTGLKTASGRALLALQSLDVHLTEYCETRDLRSLEVARKNAIELIMQINQEMVNRHYRTDQP